MISQTLSWNISEMSRFCTPHTPNLVTIQNIEEMKAKRAYWREQWINKHARGLE